MKWCFMFPSKKRYGTERAARDMIAHLGSEAPRLKTYYCNSCRGWHLTSFEKD